MHRSATLDELDLALINALQVAPRAPWSRLSGPLGVDPATLSRRWARLRDSGTAWVTCYYGPRQVSYGAFALVEVSCAPGLREQVAARLSADPHALSVEVTTGGRDLLLTVAARDLTAMGEYVLHRLGDLPGITATRTHLAQRIHREASRWRLDSLDQEQRRDLERYGDLRPDPGTISDEENRLILALAADGRGSYAQLAEAVGRPESTVRRLLSGLLVSGRVVLRGEAAHLMAGWQVTATLWLAVPPVDLDEVAECVAGMRETRLSCAVAGEANLLAQVWTHELSDLARFESQLAARYPGVRVLDRTVTLKWVKRLGRLLDSRGRSVAYVPMDLTAPVRGTARGRTAPRPHRWTWPSSGRRTTSATTLSGS
ncbi:Lrp/AsnC family transcriptional regulator [Nonomuraea sp. NN258]|uniref:Lrp/AsnC family transcriptional regulator n=1 Tax=Nonomuraea antri TaxID=2730852 RepID=UPI0015686B8A|nr:Lrp/AsnC family transcriptional regulator [Nonomuraea antri]NRQ37028.1 Lrp/AsnC family transcriptional regulator [Nonomuraea antri]